jgi:hypothetical protein
MANLMIFHSYSHWGYGFSVELVVAVLWGVIMYLLIGYLILNGTFPGVGGLYVGQEAPLSERI